ncbi:hypothetical protein P885DRAFT_28073 [Corynascus similis CBS 632.67]
MATMVTDDEVPAAAPAPKKKALPFKRTVARKQQSQQREEPNEGANNTEHDTDLDFFRHTDEVFPQILQEVSREASEVRDEKHHSRKRRKLSSSPVDSARLHTQSNTLGDSDDDDDLIMDVKGKGKEIVRPRRRSTPLELPAAPSAAETPGSSRTTRSKTAAPTRGSSRNPAGSPGVPVTILDSDDDDDDDVKPITFSPNKQRDSSNPATPARPVGASSTASSPIEILSNHNPNPDADADTDANANPPSGDDFSEWVTKARALQTSESQTAVVEVLTTSRIEGCDRPVRTRCRMNQAVQIILRAWIDRTRNPQVVIPDDVAARMFLTWKGNKIYGHSTLASLGVRVDAHGRLRDNYGEGYTRDGLHLEVWTQEAYDAYQESRSKERQVKLGAAEYEDYDDDIEGGGIDGLRQGRDGAEQVSVVQQPKKRIRVVLKTKDHEPVKLTAGEDTSVEMLIEVFRDQRKIGPEWDVSMWFDGERLEEDSVVTDLDIDPDDVNQLEVHVKRAGS